MTHRISPTRFPLSAILVAARRARAFPIAYPSASGASGCGTPNASRRWSLVWFMERHHLLRTRLGTTNRVGRDGFRMSRVWHFREDFRLLPMNPPALRATTSHENYGCWYTTSCHYFRGNRWSASSRSRLDSSPAGTSENSPLFQRWVHEPKPPGSPAGAKENARPPPPLLPSLAGLLSLLVPKPTDESVGYSRVSLRDRFPDRQECADGRPRLPGSWLRFRSRSWRCSLSMKVLAGRESSCRKKAQETQRRTICLFALFAPFRGYPLWFRLRRFGDIAPYPPKDGYPEDSSKSLCPNTRNFRAKCWAEWLGDLWEARSGAFGPCVNVVTLR